jgi:hypothetical protein
MIRDKMHGLWRRVWPCGSFDVGYLTMGTSDAITASGAEVRYWFFPDLVVNGCVIDQCVTDPERTQPPHC